MRGSALMIKEKCSKMDGELTLNRLIKIYSEQINGSMFFQIFLDLCESS